MSVVLFVDVGGVEAVVPPRMSFGSPYVCSPFFSLSDVEPHFVLVVSVTSSVAMARSFHGLRHTGIVVPGHVRTELQSSVTDRVSCWREGNSGPLFCTKAWRRKTMQLAWFSFCLPAVCISRARITLFSR
jgi:hypothetical protein